MAWDAQKSQELEILKDGRACLVGLVICGRSREMAKSGNSKFKAGWREREGVAWFRVWPWQSLDKVEGKRGVRGLD